MSTFILEDDFHAEWQGEYGSLEEALGELKRRATLRWDEEPNRCPCTSWRTCHRNYHVLEFDASTNPWGQLRDLGYLEVSADGAIWSGELNEQL